MYGRVSRGNALMGKAIAGNNTTTQPKILIRLVKPKVKSDTEMNQLKTNKHGQM